MPKGLARLVERATAAPYVGSTPDALNHDHWMTRAGQLGELGTYGNRGVNESTTIGLSAAWRCLHILADGIGALNIFAYRDDEMDARVPMTPRILSDPWMMVTPVEWRGMVVSSLLLHGNCYLLPWDIDPRTGYPRQLIVVHPEQMHVGVRDGRPVYRLDGPQGQEVDCLHIRGLMSPGAVVGIGIIEAQRMGIQMALDLDNYQSGNFREASVPPVVIKVNRPEISQEQALDIQARWVSKHGYGSRAPAVVPTSMDVTPIAWSPEDTQFLQSKQYMAAEICWWFGIDPRVLGLSASGQSLTYSNVESTYVDLQRMSFQPWTSRIEAALSRVLPRNTMARFDFAPMLRTTLQDRYAAYKVALDGGWMTIEEVRALENLGPIPAEGDTSQIATATGSVSPLDMTHSGRLPTSSQNEVL